ncbi:MAG TPA: amino acid permease, partial [Rhabdochlamydiaceae bacterium]|nr:amino acid permease [Rhabdochlamydiaceae bacterium]
ELASTFPKLGGIFFWVKEALGQRLGFLSAWLLWFQNIVWYPTILSFVAVTLAYIFDPALANNKLYTCGTILALFWAITLVNLKGMRVSGWVSTIGMILGTFLPGLFIIILGALWLVTKRPSHIEFNWNSFFPDMSSVNHWALFAGVMLSLAGIEMSAVHAKDVKNPRKDFPKAILFSALLILALSIPGILSIALVVPQQEINLVAGSLQAIAVFLESYQLNALTPYLAICIAIGALASVSTWVAGPTKALLAAAEEGDLPPLFRKVNKQQMPSALLIAQACIVSVLTFVFALLPSFNEGLWILTAILSILYLMMYLLLFASALILRFKQPHTVRPYKIPGGKAGIIFVCALGFISALFAIVIGFFPPEQLPIANKTLYVELLFGGVLLFSLGPLLIFLFSRKTIS